MAPHGSSGAAELRWGGPRRCGGLGSLELFAGRLQGLSAGRGSWRRPLKFRGGPGPPAPNPSLNIAPARSRQGAAAAATPERRFAARREASPCSDRPFVRHSSRFPPALRLPPRRVGGQGGGRSCGRRPGSCARQRRRQHAAIWLPRRAARQARPRRRDRRHRAASGLIGSPPPRPTPQGIGSAVRPGPGQRRRQAPLPRRFKHGPVFEAALPAGGPDARPQSSGLGRVAPRATFPHSSGGGVARFGVKRGPRWPRASAPD